MGELTHHLDVLVLELLSLFGQALKLDGADLFAVNRDRRVKLNGPTRGFSPHTPGVMKCAW
ncbi:MAG TPA: hypothetical protein DEP35_04720 [Deltaproteobacteria bacterium]|nr:hypothetical protein [Deltaproteobacteria bacterium]